MFPFKSLLLGVFLFLFVNSVEPFPKLTPSACAHLKKVHINENKFANLTRNVESILKTAGTDLTLVASQDIYNVDGSLKEIKTIELKVPRTSYKGDSGKSENTDYIEKIKESDDDFVDNVIRIQEDFKTSYERNCYERHVAYQKFFNNGNVELDIYVGKDESFYQDEEGVGYYIRNNIVAKDRKTFRDGFKKPLEGKDDNTLVSVLVWDVDNKFLSNDSLLEPSLVVYVNEASENVDEKMMESAINALFKFVLQPSDSVAKELSLAMSKAHPEYIWFVTKWQEDEADNAKFDEFIKLTYYNEGKDDSSQEYTVYGVKK